MKCWRGVLFTLAVLAASFARANATTCSVPNSLVNGNYVDANGLNSNFAALVSCGNHIDNTNIGSNGIFASQIKPLTVGEATFGGSEPYTFTTAVSGTTLTLTGALTTVGISDSGGITSSYTGGSSFDGLVVGTGGDQINSAASEGLYLNYTNTYGVYIGNGSGGVSGTSFSNNGNVSVGNSLTVASTILSTAGVVKAPAGVQLQLGGNATTALNLDVSGNANFSGAVKAATYITSGNGYSVGYDTRVSGQLNYHYEDGTINDVGGSGGVYNVTFVTSYANQPLGCVLTPLSYGGSAPTSGVLYITQYLGSGPYTGFTIKNGLNAAMNVSFHCWGY